jgi:hypothetical protein
LEVRSFGLGALNSQRDGVRDVHFSVWNRMGGMLRRSGPDRRHYYRSGCIGVQRGRVRLREGMRG